MTKSIIPIQRGEIKVPHHPEISARANAVLRQAAQAGYDISPRHAEEIIVRRDAASLAERQVQETIQIDADKKNAYYSGQNLKNVIDHEVNMRGGEGHFDNVTFHYQKPTAARLRAYNIQVASLSLGYGVLGLIALLLGVAVHILTEIF